MEINVVQQQLAKAPRAEEVQLPVQKQLYRINRQLSFSLENIQALEMSLSGVEATLFQTDENQLVFHLKGSVLSSETDPLPYLDVQTGGKKLAAHMIFSQNRLSQPRDLHLLIGLPRRYEQHLKLQTIHQSLQFPELKLRSLELQTITGHFAAEKLICQQASIKTVTGNILIGTAQGDLQLDTVSGQVRLDTLHSGQVKIHTVTGNCYLTLRQAPQAVKHTTITGRLTHGGETNPKSNCSLSLSSITGHFHLAVEQ